MPRLQINVEGSLAGGLGAWAVTSQWSVPSLPANEAAMNALCETIRTTLAPTGAFRTGITSGFTVLRIKALAYPVATGPVSIVGVSSGASFAGTVTAAVPPQNCVVVTERTPGAGASYRGRSFWPYGVPDAAGTVSGSMATAVTNSWIALHNAVVAALTGLSISAVHVVFSRKTGEMTPIDRVGVGSRSDIIRHRRAQGPESYSYTAVPTTFEVAQEQVAGLASNMSPEEFAEWMQGRGKLDDAVNFDDLVNEKLGFNLTDFIPIPVPVTPPPPE